MRIAKKNPPAHTSRRWRTRPLLRAFSVCLAAIAVFAPASQSQSGGGALPIRVESNEVWVPVLVLDKKRVSQLHDMDPAAFLQEANDHNSRLLEDLVVSGLSAGDFRIFEDGQEQKIDRLALNHDFQPLGPTGGGQGNWVGAARTNSYNYMGHIIHPPSWLTYLIGYSRTDSPGDSCHEVEVRVERRGSLVYSRPQYCNTKNSSADPLKGTKLGRQMQQEIDSGGAGKLTVTIRALPLFRDNGSVYLDVVLDFPAKLTKLKGDDCAAPPQVSILGAVYAKDRTVASRFSDVTSLGFDFRGRSLPLLAPGVILCTYWGPTQYRMRLDLAPGEYRLAAVVKDGNNFGRAESSVTVVEHGGNQLSVGGISLSREFRQATPAAESPTPTQEGYDPLVTGGLEVIPTADTRFEKSKPFSFFFQIYSPRESDSPAAVNARVRILDAATSRVIRELGPLGTSPFTKPGDPVISVNGGIDLSTLPSGSYQLAVQATDSSGQTTPWQSTPFSIE